MTTGYYTTTHSDTFTVTHAWHIAVKIATDLKRLQRFYGRPSDSSIENYEREAVSLLRYDFLNSVMYGFRKPSNGQYVVALKYVAQQGRGLLDDNPGRIPVGVDINGCHFYSFLSYSGKWAALAESQQRNFYKEAGVSFWRAAAEEPDGNWRNADKTYSAGGRGVSRYTVG